MTDTDHTPSEEHDRSIDIQPDYDDYGLHQQENATRIIQIDHDTHIFERVGIITSTSTGVVLKDHTRLADDESGDVAEMYEPIQFVSARTDGFEERLQDAIFDFVYAGSVSQQLAEQLSAELAESISNQYSDSSP